MKDPNLEMRWIASAGVVVGAWGLGVLSIWLLARTEAIWLALIAVGMPFLVGMLRPILRGVLTLSVISIAIAYAAFLLWYGQRDLCEGCYRDGATSTSEMIAMAVFFALLTAGVVGGGVLAGWEVNRWWRRTSSRPSV